MSGNEEDKNQKNHENAIERRFLKIEASVSFLFGTVFFFLYDNAIDVYAAESIKSYVLNVRCDLLPNFHNRFLAITKSIRK